MFIVESPSIQDCAVDRHEGGAIGELCKLLELPAVTRDVACKADLELAGKLYAKSGSDMLHISAHGCGDGIGLTDGTFVTWDDFFDIFKFPPGAILSFSSCSTLVGGKLLECAAGQAFPPSRIFGYEDTVTWADGAIASLCLTRMGSGLDFDGDEAFAFISSIFLMLKINIHSAVISEEKKKYITLTGRDAFRYLLNFAIGESVGKRSEYFEGIVTKRLGDMGIGVLGNHGSDGCSAETRD